MASTLINNNGQYFNFDIKTLVAQWVAGTYSNYGLVVKAPTWGTFNWPYFQSSDSSEAWRPILTINWSPYGTAVTPASFGRVKATFK